MVVIVLSLWVVVSPFSYMTLEQPWKLAIRLCECQMIDAYKDRNQNMDSTLHKEAWLYF